MLKYWKKHQRDPNKQDDKKEKKIEMHLWHVIFKFEFELENEATSYEYRGIKRYILLSLYDVSSTKIFKHFRGHTLLPLDDIPEIKDVKELEQLKFENRKFLFLSMNDEQRTLLHNELRIRDDERAKEYIKKRTKNYTKNYKTPTKIS